MTSGPIQPDNAPRRLDNIDARQKARLQSAVKDFETVFVGYMLKSMRSSLTTNEMFGESFGGDLMEGMFDPEFASALTKGKSFGLGEMLYRQLMGGSPEAMDVPAARQNADTKQPPVGGPADAKEHPAPAKPALDSRLEQYDAIIRDAAARNGVDPHLIKALIASESSGRADAQSNRSAKGLMQLSDSTATAMGVEDIWNPRENIFGGTRYLRTLMDRFGGDLRLALASYNAGPGTVERYGGVPPYKETRNYIERVHEFLEYFKNNGAGDGTDG